MENKTYHFFDSKLDDVSYSYYDYDYVVFNDPTIDNPNIYGSGDLDFGKANGGIFLTRENIANFESIFIGSTGYIRFSANYFQSNHAGFNVTVNATLRSKR